MNKCLFFIIIILILSLLYIFCKKKNATTDNFSPFYVTENTIWSYWEQGCKNLSPFYKMCVKTWLEKNPNHNVFILDSENVYYFLNRNDLPPNWEKIKMPQHKSDFVRLALLAKYGGIWMDISTICIRPINSVFTQSKSIEGFAYRHNSNTGDLSMYENWFITGKKNSEILTLWHKEFLKVFGQCSSANDINESYFNGVEYQNLLHYHPASYLTMNRVLLKCIQKNDRIKYLFENDTTLLGAEETAFIHYIHFGWDISSIENMFKPNEKFFGVLDLSNTPILKFTGEWNKYFNKLNIKDFNENKNNVIYKLLNF